MKYTTCARKLTRWIPRLSIICAVGVIIVYFTAGQRILSTQSLKQREIHDASVRLATSPIKSIIDRKKSEDVTNSELIHHRDRKAFLTIGIPTVCREKDIYINGTVESLLNSLKKEELNEILIVVVLSDLENSCRDKIHQILAKSFQTFMNDGILEIIRIPQDYYPSLTNLKRTFNDSIERVRWRSKQNLDYSFIMDYCKYSSTYYLQLEDDVTAAPNYFAKIKEYIKQVKKPWTMLEFSSLGFIGKLFHTEDIDKLAKLLKTFYSEQPCDFLIHYYLHIMLQSERFIRIPTLFQHEGMHSSLPKLLRNVSDIYYSTHTKRFHGNNPPASIYTTLVSWQNFKPRNAYFMSENDVFWSPLPTPGSTYTIVFKEAQFLSRIVVLTGLRDDHSDKLRAGILEISSDVVTFLEKDVVCSGYHLAGYFKNGTLDVDTTKLDTKVRCIKITITEQQNTWLVIREIAVFTKK